MSNLPQDPYSSQKTPKSFKCCLCSGLLCECIRALELQGSPQAFRLKFSSELFDMNLCYKKSFVLTRRKSLCDHLAQHQNKQDVFYIPISTRCYYYYECSCHWNKKKKCVKKQRAVFTAHARSALCQALQSLCCSCAHFIITILIILWHRIDLLLMTPGSATITYSN